MSFKERLSKEKLPKHIAIIMDGNGRWAKQKGNIRLFGHNNGAKAVNEVVEASVELGIEHLTLYAFSTENWNRPRLEIEGLMKLLVSTIDKELQKLMTHNVRLSTIGEIHKLPPKVQNKLQHAIDETANNKGTNLNLAISYSGRWEITEAIKQIANEVKKGSITLENITDNTINQYLSTYSIPDPELLIRTSGEYRISNFLLWQIAYTELFFSPKLWPDFNKEDFFEAIYSYQQRERRFGKTGEQLNSNK